MKIVEVVFSKRFTLRDDQPDTEPIESWTKDVGLTYISHRRVGNNEVALNGASFDVMRYIRTGEFTPQMYLNTVSKSPVADPPEPEDQPDGAGAHWR